MDRHAIVEHVQVALLKVHHASAGTVLDVSVLDIPLLGDRPVKNRGSRRNFDDLKRNALLNHPKCLSNSVACNAPANRVKFAGEAVQILTDRGYIGSSQLSGKFHEFM